MFLRYRNVNLSTVKGLPVLCGVHSGKPFCKDLSKKHIIYTQLIENPQKTTLPSDTIYNFRCFPPTTGQNTENKGLSNAQI